MRHIFYILVLTVIGLQLKAQGHEELIGKANQLYSESKYKEAAVLYDSIINLGYQSVEVYYNLGNSYYKMKNVPYSILNYERALLLDPNDEDVQYNLNLAKTLIVDKIEAIPDFFLTKWRKNFVRSLPSNVWATLSLSAFILALVLAIIYFFSTSSAIKKASFLTGASFLIISACTFVFAKQHKVLLTKHNTAIIVSPSLVVKSSPDNSGSDLFFLHEGTKIKVEDKIGDWLKIKISDGNKGWVLKKGIVMI